MTGAMPGSGPLVVLGDLMVDIVARVEGDPAAGSDTPARIVMQGGGSAANLAAWAALRGADVHLIGRVGDDPLGHGAIADLESLGVRTHVGLDPRAATGTCIVIVDPQGQRTMLPDQGANAALVPDDLPEHLFGPNGHLHLSGYSLLKDGSRLAALAALDLARRAGMSTSVDASSTAPLLDLGPSRFLELTTGIDICLANEAEAAILSGAADPLAAAAALLGHYDCCVVKLGGAGALAQQRGGEPVSVPAVPTDVIDTTGAGDAFAAGFLMTWRTRGRGSALTDALAQGTVLAARAVARVGGRP